MQVKCGGKITSGNQRAGATAAYKTWRVVLKDEVVTGIGNEIMEGLECHVKEFEP